MRVFADCEDTATAQEILSSLNDVLSKFVPKVHNDPKPYWKIPGQFEFTFTFAAPGKDKFTDIVGSCDTGWLHIGSDFDTSSVWNRTAGHMFLIPEISWGEITLHEYPSVR